MQFTVHKTGGKDSRVGMRARAERSLVPPLLWGCCSLPLTGEILAIAKVGSCALTFLEATFELLCSPPPSSLLRIHLFDCLLYHHGCLEALIPAPALAEGSQCLRDRGTCPHELRVHDIN